jgi:hypothetical protein
MTLQFMSAAFFQYSCYPPVMMFRPNEWAKILTSLCWISFVAERQTMW